MKKILLPFALVAGFVAQAQEFETPNTGVNWSLEEIVNASPTSVSFDGTSYTVNEDILVAENDTLTFNPGEQILVDEDVRFTIEGTLQSIGEENNEVFIDALDSITPYNGFRFEHDAVGLIDYTFAKNGGGFKVLTSDFTVTNSKFMYNVQGVATGAVIDLSYGSPLVQNNTFIENATPAISSPANFEVSAQIIGNYIEANVQLNENRPQINMGTTGSDTLRIKGNTIIGDRNMIMSGGIAVSNLLGSENGITAVIEGNTIVDNRYGITVAGGYAYVKITGNVIEDNDTQGEPMLGGSGISINSNIPGQLVVASNNEIRRNLWGVTVIDKAVINLGDDLDNPGQNVFSENENGGQTYAIYNNSPNEIMAKHNCWIEGQEITLEEAATVIFDAADDASLGEVIYDPIGCESELGIANVTTQEVVIYPNPAQNVLYLANNTEFNEYAILSMDGRIVQQGNIDFGDSQIALNLRSGVYTISLRNNEKQSTQKIIIE